ncbi:hypothetical protein [Paenibacillus thalictri]|uniref:hypothetical protein n=1 Tax=Paenibacillus thalictri TaxID=2527873 RepID=UPI0013EF537D|nr:hypothetical protein [Paenibacillus thalictri]
MAQFEPSNPQHPEQNPTDWLEYRKYVASIPGLKLVVVEDPDKPKYNRRLLG